jgi:hypothetical protein
MNQSSLSILNHVVRLGCHWAWSHSIRYWSALIAFSTVLAGSADAQPADFGDAPATYPTLLADGGVHHLVTGKEWIGPPGSITSTEADALLPDGDADDGIAYVVDYASHLNFLVQLSHDGNEAATVRYLNVLVDFDFSGTWDGSAAEWLVQNHAFTFEDIFPAGFNSGWLMLGIDSSYSAAWFLDKWCRVTVSTEPVADGTGAWGPLARGETEDLELSGAPITKPTLRPNVPARFVPTASVFRHGVEHAVDVEVADAHLVFRFPAEAKAPCEYSIRARRVADSPNDNRYEGDVDPDGANLKLPEPGAGWTDWSDWQDTPPPLPGAGWIRLPIKGQFSNKAAAGDSDFRFQVRLRYDPEGDAVQHDSGAIEIAGNVTTGSGGITFRMINHNNGNINNTPDAMAYAAAPPPSQVIADKVETVDAVNFGSGGSFNPQLFPKNPLTLGSDNFIGKVKAKLTIPAGNWSLAIGSDDGCWGSLPGVHNFMPFGEDANGSIVSGQNEFMHYWGRAWGTTGCSFTTSEETIVDFEALFFEQGGGEAFQIAICNNAQGGCGTTINPANGWVLLRDSVLGWGVEPWNSGNDPYGQTTIEVGGRNVIGVQDASKLNLLRIGDHTYGIQDEYSPGLTMEFWGTGGNPGNFLQVQELMNATSSFSGEVKSADGSGWWSGPYYNFPDFQNYPTLTLGLPTGQGGQFGDVNNDNYIARLTGQILFPESGVYKFKDGVDDYTSLRIDLNDDGDFDDPGEHLINDNNWADPLGGSNGGSPIVELNITTPEGGKWANIEFITSEAGGGDSGMLYWTRPGGSPGFPTSPSQSIGNPQALAIPTSHLRSIGVAPLDAATLTFNAGTDDAGKKVTYRIEVDRFTGTSDTIIVLDPNPEVFQTELNVDGATFAVAGLGGTSPTPGQTFTIAQADQITGLPLFNFPAGQSWNVSQFNETGSITFLGQNQAPAIGTLNNRTLLEDGSLNITFTVSDADGDPVELTATSNKPGLLGDLTVDGTGETRTLALNPIADQNGHATVTVTATDGQSSTTGGFMVTVIPVNDPPTGQLTDSHNFHFGAPGARTSQIISEVSAGGAADESGQIVEAVVTANTNPGLFSDQPVVSLDANGTGTLTYSINGTPGNATLTIGLTDNGGTDFGGENARVLGDITISVAPAAIIAGITFADGVIQFVGGVQPGWTIEISTGIHEAGTPWFPGDFNGDGKIDSSDLEAHADNPETGIGDSNADRKVDFDDVETLFIRLVGPE